MKKFAAIFLLMCACTNDALKNHSLPAVLGITPGKSILKEVADLYTFGDAIVGKTKVRVYAIHNMWYSQEPHSPINIKFETYDDDVISSVTIHYESKTEILNAILHQLSSRHELVEEETLPSGSHYVLFGCSDGYILVYDWKNVIFPEIMVSYYTKSSYEKEIKNAHNYLLKFEKDTNDFIEEVQKFQESIGDFVKQMQDSKKI
jgi:hypothetical protein